MTPTWITQNPENDVEFLIDGDALRGSVLPDVKIAIARKRTAEAEAASDEPVQPISPEDVEFDRYVAVVCEVFAKFDAQVAVSMNYGLKDKWKRHRVKGGPDYKQRWGVQHQKPGKYEEIWQEDPLKFELTVSREAKALYRSVRSVMPS